MSNILGADPALQVPSYGSAAQRMIHDGRMFVVSHWWDFSSGAHNGLLFTGSTTRQTVIHEIRIAYNGGPIKIGMWQGGSTSGAFGLTGGIRNLKLSGTPLTNTTSVVRPSFINENGTRIFEVKCHAPANNDGEWCSGDIRLVFPVTGTKMGLRVENESGGTVRCNFNVLYYEVPLLDA